MNREGDERSTNSFKSVTSSDTSNFPESALREHRQLRNVRLFREGRLMILAGAQDDANYRATLSQLRAAS